LANATPPTFVNLFDLLNKFTFLQVHFIIFRSLVGEWVSSGFVKSKKNSIINLIFIQHHGADTLTCRSGLWLWLYTQRLHPGYRWRRRWRRWRRWRRRRRRL
jgi:hypothetical protein